MYVPQKIYNIDKLDTQIKKGLKISKKCINKKKRDEHKKIHKSVKFENPSKRKVFFLSYIYPIYKIFHQDEKIH